MSDDDPKKVLKEVEEIVTRMNRLEQSILERLDNLERQMKIVLEGKRKSDKAQSKSNEIQKEVEKPKRNDYICKDCHRVTYIDNREQCDVCDEYVCYDCYRWLANRIICEECYKTPIYH